MKHFMFVLVLFFYLFSYQPAIFAAGTSTNGDQSVYSTIQKGGEKVKSSPAKVVDNGSQPSIFSLLIKFIFSFILVVGLLIVLLRFLSKRNHSLQSSGPVVHLGGLPLGNNRSLQILLIGQTIYIIGVGDTVTLLRTISQGEEYQHLLESVENEEVGQPLPNWLAKDPKKLWNDTFFKYLNKIKKDNGEE